MPNIFLPSSSGGGASGFSPTWIENVNSPIFVNSDLLGSPMYVFEDGSSSTLYTIFKVPNSYLTGTQIFLKGQLYLATASGTCLLSSQCVLIRPGTDTLTSVTNLYNSTNAAITPVSNKPASFSCDLTSSSGQINSINVSAGDVLKVFLFRGTDTETASINLLSLSCEVTFA